MNFNASQTQNDQEPEQASNLYYKKKEFRNGDFFNHLEEKLLMKSDKLTKLIGISYLSKFPKLKGRLNKSPNKDNSLFLLNKAITKGKRRQNVNLKQSDTHISKLHLQQNLTKSQRSNTKQQQPNSVESMQRKLAYNPHCLQKHQQTNKNASLNVHKAFSMKLLNSQFSDSFSTETSIYFNKLGKKILQETNHNNITISDFYLLSQLGKGKFGNVYLARHCATNFLCAIKKVAKKLIDEKIIIQLLRELKIQSYLDHPNIVQLYKFFWDEDHIYLVLQVCSSGHLYEHLRRSGSMTQASVSEIMRQICNAVEYMHENDIIHRDLKPENILLHQGIAKVCDFGWSVCSPLMRKTFCGTPLYVSPELLQKKNYDNKIDIWGIGILTYQLLFGRVPFEIRYEEDLFKIISEQIYFPKESTVSEEAIDFINKCLDKEPHKRYSINKLLDHEFITKHNKKTIR